MKLGNFFTGNGKSNPLGLLIGLGTGLAIALPISIFAVPQIMGTSSPEPSPTSSTSTSLVNPGSDEDQSNSETSASEEPNTTSQPSPTGTANPGSTSSSSQPPSNFVAQTTPQSATAPPNPNASTSGSITALQYFFVSGSGRASCNGATYVSGRVIIPSLPDWRGLGTTVYAATYLQESNGGRATNGSKDIWQRDSIGSDWNLVVSGGWTPTVEVKCSRLVTTQITPTPTPSPSLRWYRFTEQGQAPLYCSSFRANSTLLTGRIVFPNSVTWEGLEVIVRTATFVPINNGGSFEGGAIETWTRPNESSSWVLSATESWTPVVEITCEYQQ